MTTKNTAAMNAMIASLTIEQAREWRDSPEQWTWVEYTLLDPNGIERWGRNVMAAERAMEKLLTAEFLTSSSGAFNYGWSAYMIGYARSQNPHSQEPPPSAVRDEWFNGWDYANAMDDSE